MTDNYYLHYTLEHNMYNIIMLRDTASEKALEDRASFTFGDLDFFLIAEQLRVQLLSLLQSLSPLNMSSCNTINATPTAALYHAIDRNWLMGSCANMTATPMKKSVIIFKKTFSNFYVTCKQTWAKNISNVYANRM